MPKIMIIPSFALAMALLIMPVVASSQTADEDAAHMKAGHKKVEGVVTGVKSGLYTVKTPSGSYTLNENASIRHGHGAPKVGDAMTLWVNESNMVVDAHPKEQAAKAHSFISGKLESLDNVKSEIKLTTPQGVKSFKIRPETRNFAEIPKGASVKAELNEKGEVIDIHKEQ